MYSLKLITAAASTTPAISLEEAKAHLNITANEYDDEVERKVASATRWCERNVSGHMQHMVATWEWIANDFPCSAFTLPLPPLHSVVSVKYRSSTGSTHQAFASTNYITETPTDAPGWIELKPDETWPSVYAVENAVKIQFKAGSTSSTGVSATAKEATKMVLDELWNQGHVRDEVKESVFSFLGCDEYGAYS